ncbi:expressed protein [Phakopsora pachyrhizi]|uniref:Expressed protein n=1 Tax=Phakopsora pachyrhizi TaxID=170000 RepID=A0AAV0AR48_PHAPC|nr:expressed protein [Phakopsora pachyrhizi]
MITHTHSSSVKSVQLHNITSSHSSSLRQSQPSVSNNFLPTCANCSTQTTPLWRRGDSGVTLCNACALFQKMKGRPRPISLKTDVIKQRNRLKTSDRDLKNISLDSSHSIKSEKLLNINVAESEKTRVLRMIRPRKLVSKLQITNPNSIYSQSNLRLPPASASDSLFHHSTAPHLVRSLSHSNLRKQPSSQLSIPFNQISPPLSSRSLDPQRRRDYPRKSDPGGLDNETASDSSSLSNLQRSTQRQRTHLRPTPSPGYLTPSCSPSSHNDLSTSHRATSSTSSPSQDSNPHFRTCGLSPVDGEHSFRNYQRECFSLNPSPVESVDRSTLSRTNSTGREFSGRNIRNALVPLDIPQREPNHFTSIHSADHTINNENRCYKERLFLAEDLNSSRNKTQLKRPVVLPPLSQLTCRIGLNPSPLPKISQKTNLSLGDWGPPTSFEASAQQASRSSSSPNSRSRDLISASSNGHGHPDQAMETSPVIKHPEKRSRNTNSWSPSPSSESIQLPKFNHGVELLKSPLISDSESGFCYTPDSRSVSEIGRGLAKLCHSPTSIPSARAHRITHIIETPPSSPESSLPKPAKSDLRMLLNHNTERFGQKTEY